MFVLTGLPAGTAADFEPDRRAPHAAPGGTRGLGADAPQGTEARYRRLRMGLPAHGASIDQLADSRIGLLTAAALATMGMRHRMRGPKCMAARAH